MTRICHRLFAPCDTLPGERSLSTSTPENAGEFHPATATALTEILPSVNLHWDNGFLTKMRIVLSFFYSTHQNRTTAGKISSVERLKAQWQWQIGSAEDHFGGALRDHSYDQVLPHSDEHLLLFHKCKISMERVYFLPVFYFGQPLGPPSNSECPYSSIRLVLNPLYPFFHTNTFISYLPSTKPHMDIGKRDELSFSFWVFHFRSRWNKAESRGKMAREKV